MPVTPGSEEPPDVTPSGRFEEEEPPPAYAKPLFAHPQWMVGIVLILGAMFMGMGMQNPVWLLIGAPCIVVLVLYVFVKLWSTRQRG